MYFYILLRHFLFTEIPERVEENPRLAVDVRSLIFPLFSSNIRYFAVKYLIRLPN